MVLVIRFMVILMCPVSLFLSVDPSLGRVEYSLLSDQTLMEMFGSCVACDDDGGLTEIDLDSGLVSGFLTLCYVPPEVKELKMSSLTGSELTGTADLTHLPAGMQVLDLRNNQLTGKLDLTQLPRSMFRLYLYGNQFSGEVDLTKLPDALRWLSLNNNEFTGEIDLTQLPKRMIWLSLSNNRLTGEIDLTRLPEGMGELSLENNQFSGSFAPEISTISAGGNQFNAIAVVGTQAAEVFIRLQGSGVTSVVDENGHEQDMQLFLEEVEIQMG